MIVNLQFLHLFVYLEMSFECPCCSHDVSYFILADRAFSPDGLLLLVDFGYESFVLIVGHRRDCEVAHLKPLSEEVLSNHRDKAEAVKLRDLSPCWFLPSV